jgi:predicted nucleotide-binding protein
VPTKQKKFLDTKFSPETLLEAARFLELPAYEMHVYDGREVEWSFEGPDELHEFWSMYRDDENCAEAAISFVGDRRENGRVRVLFKNDGSLVSVRAPKRSVVESIFHIFESNLRNAALPEERRGRAKRRALRIFVGHGRSPLWRDLKDHLSDKHNYNVVAFETSARAGMTVSEVLEEMEESASFAIMVMTAENEGADGKMHARENVIHEVGLFQGTLGSHKVVVLLEEGCEEFSNRAGVQYIPFAKGNIKEAFGEVLATLKREYG